MLPVDTACTRNLIDGATLVPLSKQLRLPVTDQPSPLWCVSDNATDYDSPSQTRVVDTGTPQWKHVENTSPVADTVKWNRLGGALQLGSFGSRSLLEGNFLSALLSAASLWLVSTAQVATFHT